MSSKYYIEIDYRTGNSFGSERSISSISDIEWSNLEIAKENLAAIKEHYLFTEEVDNYSSLKKQKEVINKYKDRFWFPMGHESMYNHYINLKQDDGSLKEIHTFWTGYFERLYGAEIKSSNSGLKFEI